MAAFIRSLSQEQSLSAHLSEPWFLVNTEEDEVIEELEFCANGRFTVWKDGDRFIVSVVHEGEVNSYDLVQDSNGEFSINGGSAHSSIKEWVYYHRTQRASGLKAALIFFGETHEDVQNSLAKAIKARNNWQRGFEKVIQNVDSFRGKWKEVATREFERKNRNQLENQILELKKQHSEQLEAIAKDNEQKLDQCFTKIKSLEQDNSDLRQQLEGLSSLAHELASTKNHLSSAQDAIKSKDERIRQLVAGTKGMTTISKEVEHLRNLNAQTERQVASLKAQLESSQQNYEQAQLTISLLEAENSKLKNDKDMLESTNQQQQSDTQQLQQAISDQKSQISELESVNQADSQKLEKTISDLRSQISKTEMEHRQQVADLHHQHQQEILKLQSKISEIEGEGALLKSDKERLEFANQRQQADAQQLRNQISNLKLEIARIGDTNTSVSQLTAEISELQMKLSNQERATRDNQADIDRYESQFEVLSQEKSELMVELAASKSKIESLSLEITQLNSEVDIRSVRFEDEMRSLKQEASTVRQHLQIELNQARQQLEVEKTSRNNASSTRIVEFEHQVNALQAEKSELLMKISTLTSKVQRFEIEAKQPHHVTVSTAEVKELQRDLTDARKNAEEWQTKYQQLYLEEHRISSQNTQVKIAEDHMRKAFMDKSEMELLLHGSKNEISLVLGQLEATEHIIATYKRELMAARKEIGQLRAIIDIRYSSSSNTSHNVSLNNSFASNNSSRNNISFVSATSRKSGNGSFQQNRRKSQGHSPLKYAAIITNSLRNGAVSSPKLLEQQHQQQQQHQQHQQQEQQHYQHQHRQLQHQQHQQHHEENHQQGDLKEREQQQHLQFISQLQQEPSGLPHHHQQSAFAPPPKSIEELEALRTKLQNQRDDLREQQLRIATPLHLRSVVSPTPRFAGKADDMGSPQVNGNQQQQQVSRMNRNYQEETEELSTLDTSPLAQRLRNQEDFMREQRRHAMTHNVYTTTTTTERRFAA